MALRIDTFDNLRGGNTLYKALTHPHAARPARALVAALARAGPTAVVAPQGAAERFAEIYALDGIEIPGGLVHDLARVGAAVRCPAAPPGSALVRRGAPGGTVARVRLVTMSSNTPWTLPVRPARTATARSHAPMTRMHGRPSAMPACRHRHRASG